MFRAQISRHPIPRFYVRRTPRSGVARWVEVESDPRSLAQVVSCDHQHTAWPIRWDELTDAVIQSLRAFSPEDVAAGRAIALVDLPGNDPALARRIMDRALTDEDLEELPVETPEWLGRSVEQTISEAAFRESA